MPVGVPLSYLKSIDIQKLRDENKAEKLKLLTATKDEGFFYPNFKSIPN